jgi:UDPglucose 6-dehydrogenase/GDP-mannose 6-dehydrogenase
MKVAIIGTGYVGLVTGACLAEKGHDVVCVDVDPAKISLIQRGAPPIYEPGLEPLLRRNVGRRLQATTDLRAAVRGSELSLIAVGTPFDGSQIDLSAVQEAARQIGEVLRDTHGYHTVVVKSTVVPGTTEGCVVPVLEQASGKRAGSDFGVGMNPEFLTEGQAVEDFMTPDRIVLGAIDARSLAALEALYVGFVGVPRLRTNPRTAEMIKYAANALLATMISFANEIGNLGAALGGIDVVDVMQGVHLGKYVTATLADGTRVAPAMTDFLAAGCGFGGSCLPKDVKALIAHGAKAGQPMRMLEAVMDVNLRQPGQILSRLKKHYPSLQGLRVAVLGLAFRPQTSDTRESPAIPVIEALLAEGARVQAYDPAANDEARRLFRNGQVRLCDDLAGAVRDVEAVVLVTSWQEFRQLADLVRGLPSPPLVVDGRRLLDKVSVPRYEGIGL